MAFCPCRDFKPSSLGWQYLWSQQHYDEQNLESQKHTKKWIFGSERTKVENLNLRPSGIITHLCLSVHLGTMFNQDSCDVISTRQWGNMQTCIAFLLRIKHQHQSIHSVINNERMVSERVVPYKMYIALFQNIYSEASQPPLTSSSGKEQHSSVNILPW